MGRIVEMPFQHGERYEEREQQMEDDDGNPLHKREEDQDGEEI